MSVFSRRPFKTVIFSRYLKVAMTTSNFMNEVYNGGFAPAFSVSVLKEFISLVRSYLYKTRKWKAKLAEKYMWIRSTKSFSNFWVSFDLQQERQNVSPHSRERGMFLFNLGLALFHNKKLPYKLMLTNLTN